MEYLITYNAECDFIVAASKEQATQEIESLIRDQYSSEEISLYEIEPKEFEVITHSITISIGD